MREMVEASLREVAPGTELHFVIAEQLEFQQRALDGYYLMKTLWSESGHEPEQTFAKQLKGMTPELPVDWPGLQAADLLVNRWFFAMHKDGIVNSWNVRLMNLLSRERNSIPIANRRFMDEALNEAGVDRPVLQALPDPFQS
jgi:hypothetical protein